MVEKDTFSEKKGQLTSEDTYPNFFFSLFYDKIIYFLVFLRVGNAQKADRFLSTLASVIYCLDGKTNRTSLVSIVTDVDQVISL